MAEENDLLPWVLGAMLTLGAVAAIAVGLPDPPLGSATAAPNTAVAASTAQAAPNATPASHPTSSVGTSAVVVAASPRPQLPPGQVWECQVNGQRVFSDVQCGTHATVRQLTELNVFDPSTSYGRGSPRGSPPPYGSRPGTGPGYYPQSMPASEPLPDDSDAGGGDPIYTQVIAVHDRAWRLAHRANHPHPRAAAHHP